MGKICCQSTIRNCHAAITMRFTTLSCKTQQYSARSCSNEEPWRSHPTAICRHWVPKHKRIATHCGTHMNTSVGCSSSNAQNVATHAKHDSTASTKKRTSHLEPSVPLRAQFKQVFTVKRRRPHPSRTRANFSPQRSSVYPKETQCFMQILTFKSHSWWSSSNAISQEWLAKHHQDHKTVLQSSYTIRTALTQPFDCDLRTLSCKAQENCNTLWNTSLGCSSSNAQSYSTHAKHNSTASAKKRKSHLETLCSTARAVQANFYGKATTPAPVALASQLFSATEVLFTRKNTMPHNVSCKS